MTFIPPLPPKQVASQAAFDAVRGKLHLVAKYQRWVLLALLFNISFALLFLATAFGLLDLPAHFLQFLGYLKFAACIFMTISAFLLAKQFWHVVLAILCAAMMWVPFGSLLTLIIVNQMATRLLQKWGIKVGLLGANPSKI